MFYIIDEFINHLNYLVILTKDDIRFQDLNKITLTILDYTNNLEDINIFNESITKLSEYIINIKTISNLDDLSFIISITNNIKIIIDLLNTLEYKIRNYGKN